MPMPTRAPLLENLRQQLQWIPEDDSAESWIDGGELYLLIRLCLFAHDRRCDAGHGVEAEGLFGALVAEYARRGEYTAVSRGRLIYHAPGLADAAGALEL